MEAVMKCPISGSQWILRKTSPQTSRLQHLFPYCSLLPKKEFMSVETLEAQGEKWKEESDALLTPSLRPDL